MDKYNSISYHAVQQPDLSTSRLSYATSSKALKIIVSK